MHCAGVSADDNYDDEHEMSIMMMNMMMMNMLMSINDAEHGDLYVDKHDENIKHDNDQHNDNQSCAEVRWE